MAYDTVATENSINSAIESLSKRNIEAVTVNTKSEALSMIKDLVPAGASVMNGSSTTLIEIGFVDYLKSDDHKWINMHEPIIKESDPTKQAVLRQAATHSDFYLGSAQALTESGELLIASNTGSQLPNIVFTSKNLILVLGTQKIVKSLDEAITRLKEHVVPLEDKRSMAAYGAPTSINQMLIFQGNNPYMGRSVKVIIVKEALGY
jgi:prefoldin subunit 5